MELIINLYWLMGFLNKFIPQNCRLINQLAHLILQNYTLQFL